MSQSRLEHPRPQFQRDQWMNLNGIWDFAFDFGLSGREKGWHEDPSGLDQKINVPFCPESKLSGIAYTDFINTITQRPVVLRRYGFGSYHFHSDQEARILQFPAMTRMSL